MGQEPDVLETAAEPTAEAAEAVTSQAEGDREPAPPIESRFLYVDVAAQRAKQLRRGALPRLDELAGGPEAEAPSTLRYKLERIAMREVDRGKIHYDVPASGRGE